MWSRTFRKAGQVAPGSEVEAGLREAHANASDIPAL